MAKANVAQVKKFFEEGSIRGKLTMADLKALKESNGGRDWDQLAEGIGDGTLTY